MTRVVGAPNATLAVATPAQAFVLAGLVRLGARRPVLVVTPTGVAAEQLAHDLEAFTDGDGPEGAGRVELFPAWETLPFERVSPDVSTMGRRLRLLWQLGAGPTGGGGDPDAAAGRADIVVAPIKAVLQRLGPWRTAARPVVVGRGDRVDVDELVTRLVGMGYRRESIVEHRGELAVRGGIVDVFPSTADEPVRIDLWGDEVDRLTRFDVADQRSIDDVGTVDLFGCRELVTDETMQKRARELVGSAPWGRHQWDRLADGEQFDGMESWLPWLVDSEELVCDLLGDDAVIVLVEPRRVRDRAGELLDEESALADALASTWGLEAGAAAPRLHVPFDRLLTETAAGVVSLVPTAEGPDVPLVESRGWEPILGDGAKLAAQVSGLAEAGYAVVLCSSTAGGAARLSGILAEEGLTVPVAPGAPERTGGGPDLAAPGARIVVAAVDRGFVLPGARVAVLTESDVTGRRRPHRQARTRARPVDGFFDDLAPGNYVVHRQHGVAVYGGMVTRTMGGATRDYLLLEYRGGDKLYLPTDQIELLTPYAGGDSPAVSRLGGSEWQRARAKARAAVHEVAEELVALYRRRLQVTGHAYGPDTPWQAELESSFPFVETSDQLSAIEDVKADMELPQPMDRLVCGDVGFGKTEVAIRAVFKAVQDGFQAAVLVPTTLLASQHAQTFAERYAPFPVKVEMLSRFLTNAQARAVLAGLADGSVDVVVGTHRLLAGDVTFKKLGLLVVDEEQRFGVSHKESIKALAEGVDVLTLTASPIPRTLEMALTGIRDLSMVNTPPAARRPILTHVGEFEEAAASEAIRRELLREGQVFYVHNRVQDIEAVAIRVQAMAPEARVAVAHGQMDEGTLEQVVLDFWEGAYDVLVCTTIIESGIDMPTVNTLVVDRADLLGLGGPGRAAGLRLPVLPCRPGPFRAGLRAPADHRGPHRARLGVQDRPAGPADPGGGQPARARPVGPHRRRRLRPLRPDGVRGGVRAEGGAPAPTGGVLPRPPRCRPSAVDLRRGRGRPPRGLPAAHRCPDHRADRGRPRRVGGPLRTPPGTGVRAARRGPVAGRVPPGGDHRHRGDRPASGHGAWPRRARLGQALADHPAGIGRGAAAPSCSRVHLPARHAPAAAAPGGSGRWRVRPGPGGPVGSAGSRRGVTTPTGRRHDRPRRGRTARPRFEEAGPEPVASPP